MVLGSGCGGDKSSEPDATPPATVSDLRIWNSVCGDVVLAWTAPGDDGTSGRAASYDLRRSTATITESNWASATQCQGEPTPKPAGQTDSYSIADLAAGATYYFAIKVTDDGGNESGLSNVCQETVGLQSVAWVNDGLAADADWTNSGAGLSANWYHAACSDSYQYAIGTTQGGTNLADWTGNGVNVSVTRTGLGLAEGQTYYFTVRNVVGALYGAAVSSDGITVDLTPPVSQVVALPAETEVPVFTVTWTGSDAASGVKQYDVQVSGDGGLSWGSWQTATTLTSAEFTGLDDSTYHFRSRAYDNAGNLEAYPDAPDAYTTVDLPPPLQVDHVNDGVAEDADWAASSTALSGNWRAVGGAAGYQCAVDTAAGGADVAGWASVGLDTSATRSGLSLAEGQTYYFSVKVVSGAVPGPAVSSDGIRVDSQAPASSVNALAPATSAYSFAVTWAGSDAVSGVGLYDVQVKDGSGAWTDWQTATALTAHDFTGSLDHVYSFRSRAYDVAGNIEAYPAAADAMTAVTCTYAYSMKWGIEGAGEGEFNGPVEVAVDASGNVYVADDKNNRIQVFDPGGNFMRQWGGPGSGDGKFSGAKGVAVDDSGYVFTTDFYNARVQKFRSDGTFVAKWGTPGSAPNQFQYPRGIAVDASFNVYVADAGNNRIQKFTSNGSFVGIIGSSGSGDGQLSGVMDVAVGPAGTIYAVDAYNRRIQEFTSSGTYLNKWGSFGAGDGQFKTPVCIEVNAGGRVYVTDYTNNRIQTFTSGGLFLAKWGSQGADDGQFNQACGLALTAGGSALITDYSLHRIQKFSPSCP
jgi:hypothetical protein